MHSAFLMRASNAPEVEMPVGVANAGRRFTSNVMMCVGRRCVARACTYADASATASSLAVRRGVSERLSCLF